MSPVADECALRVLLIEDSEDDALLLLRELRKAGYDPCYRRVETARDMTAALLTDTWDVIISDHAMPRFNALAALEIYKEQDLDIPFLIVSGAIGETQAVEAMRSGAHDYVLKGNLARLVPAIERELMESAERRARRRAEQDLTRAGKEWSETFDAVSDLICVLTPDCRVAARQCRPRPGPRGGGPDPSAREVAITTLFLGTEQPYACPCRETPSGSDMVFPKLSPDRTFEVTFSPILDEQGAPRAFVQVARDVTEQRQLQAQLLQSQKLAALGEIISGIAHELNNPLAAVVAHAQLLRRQHLSQEAEQSAEAVEDSALRASRVVQSLLAFSRQQPPQRVPVNLNQVIEETLALRAGTLRSDNIEVARRTGPRSAPRARRWLPIAAGAPQPHQQRPARDEQAPAPLPHASITEKKNGRLLVRVKDTGVGIPAGNLSRIFEPFFTTQEVGQGTGLGLSVCHGIVEDHGGSIRVSSRGGRRHGIRRGTAGRAGTIRVEVAPAPAASVPAGLHVLVVEDEMLIRLALQRVLQDLGATVGSASNGVAALKALEKAQTTRSSSATSRCRTWTARCSTARPSPAGPNWPSASSSAPATPSTRTPSPSPKNTASASSPSRSWRRTSRKQSRQAIS